MLLLLVLLLVLWLVLGIRLMGQVIVMGRWTVDYGQMNGRDMVLICMRMVKLWHLLIVIMMRWWRRLLLWLLLLVMVILITIKMGHLKMQLMIHATTVNRARNWGHVLLRLDFQWAQQRR